MARGVTGRTTKRQLGRGEFVPELSPVAAAQAARDRELYRQLGLAIGDYLIANGRMSRAIHRLELYELEGMAAAVISKWSDFRAEEAKITGQSILTLEPAEDIRLVP